MLGFILGIIIGGIIGLLFISLGKSAKSYSDEYEGIHKYRGFEFVSTEQLEKSFGEDRNEAILKLPKRATKGSAGYDLYACIGEPLVIQPGQVQKVPTGVAIELADENCVALVFARSSMGIKYGVIPANAVGVIDSDYRGEVCVFLRNHSDAPYTVQPQDRVAQLVVMPVGFWKLGMV